MVLVYVFQYPLYLRHMAGQVKYFRYATKEKSVELSGSESGGEEVNFIPSDICSVRYNSSRVNEL